MAEETFYFTHGDLNCMVFNEKNREGAADQMYASVPEAERNAVLAEFGLDGVVPSAINVLLINTGDEQILIDTGLGQGALYTGLETEGVSYRDIDHIIITHGHGDHIGGILDNDGEIVFPNAQYWINETEWGQWQPSGDSYSELQEKVKATLPSDRVHLISGDGEFMAGFSPMYMPGHCKGMMGVIVESGGEKMLHIADVMHHPLQVKYPDWCVGFDRDKPKARETRRRVWQRAAAEDMLVFSYHVWKGGRGRISESGDSYEWDWITP